MKISISEHLIRMAMRMLIAYATPEQVVKLMETFRKLFMDDENFIPYEEWGEDVAPFTLSDRGLNRVENLRQDPLFEKAFMSAIRNKQQPNNLLYALTQILVLLHSNIDTLDLVAPGHQEEKKSLLDSMLRKFRSVEYRVNPLHLYKRHVPQKTYTPEEHQKAKNKVMQILDRVEKDYRKVDLNPEEEEYWKASLKPS